LTTEEKKDTAEEEKLKEKQEPDQEGTGLLDTKTEEIDTSKTEEST
jgi:hypothetical protein